MNLGKKALALLAFIAVISAAAVWLRGSSETEETYQTVLVKRGDLVAAITATGTLEPEEVVDVGAQVAGQIQSFGTDAEGKEVDYRSNVEEGTVLARIDSSLYESDVAQADAQLKRAQADVMQAQSKLTQAQRDWGRVQKIGPSRAVAESSYDNYRFTQEIAEANLALSQAAVKQAEATLSKAQRNLKYCTITSPVKGVVIDRRVNIGQTVVASLNAPSLFLIAKDLKRMQVWAAVNEADIGQISPGQPVSFTVDAFPDRTFSGEVIRVRLNASMVQSVVTYTVEIATDNSEGLLLPYLTANVRFVTTEAKNVMLVPNAALRWTPAAASNSEKAASLKTSENQSRVWRLIGGKPQPLTVQVGQTDGAFTEIRSPELKEGDLVVAASVLPEEDADASNNPLAPQFPHGKTKTSGSAASPQRH